MIFGVMYAGGVYEHHLIVIIVIRAVDDAENFVSRGLGTPRYDGNLFANKCIDKC